MASKKDIEIKERSKFQISKGNSIGNNCVFSGKKVIVFTESS